MEKTFASGNVRSFDRESFVTSSSSTIRLFLSLNKDFPIESVKTELQKIIDEYPFIIECSISIELSLPFQDDKFCKLLSYLQNMKFGTGKKAPMVYLFLPICQEFDTIVSYINNYNSIDNFIHLVSVIDVETPYENIDEIILCNQKMVKSFFIDHTILLNVSDLKFYILAIEYLKRFRSFLLDDNVSFWLQIKEISLYEKIHNLRLLNIFQTLQTSLEYVSLLPQSMMDILYCAEQLSRNEVYYRKDTEDITSILYKITYLLRNHHFEFVPEKGIFKRLSPTNYDKNVIKYIASNLEAIGNSRMQEGRTVKVRAAMSDFAPSEAI